MPKTKELIMKKTLLNILKSVAFLSFGAFLFYLVYRGKNFAQIWHLILQAKLQWILLSIVLALLSHFSRAYRWKLMLKPLGYNPRVSTLFYSVMTMYFLNLAIPRSGELIRAGIVNKYEDIPFSELFGTIVTERVIDFLMLFLFLAVVIVTQMKYLLKFLNNNPQIKSRLFELMHSTPVLIGITIGLIALLVIIYLLRHKLRKIKLIDKIFHFAKQFWNGLKSVAHLKNKGLFILLTFIIWILYYLMIYVVFFAFPFTKHLPPIAGLTIFVLASFGMVFPSPGGMGSWHFMTIEGLKLYGVKPNPDGLTFAFAAHESQILMLIIVGIFSMVALSLTKKISSKSQS